MKFVIVTGMSGGGKRTALKILEDMGFYCVDNLPLELVNKFAELVVTPSSERSKVALGLDVRADQTATDIQKSMEKLKADGYIFELIYLDAADSVLVKRYKESRRLHPLSAGGSVEDGINNERRVLATIKKRADYILDTTNLLTRELREELERIFMRNEEYNSLIVNIVSFGFKYGIPSDSDLVFDVRFLPNPFYIEELKHKTGNEEEVWQYVLSFPESIEFLDKLTDMVEFLIPNYVKEGKHQLVISIGCTGGQHRSVTLANQLYNRLKNKGGYGLTIRHRNIPQGL